MHRFAVLMAAAAALSAQDTPDLFKKAPPGVEEALRERVRQFYQFHVEGKFRQAEQLVAEDTKDFFFTSGKPRYLSFEISKIEYSEDFTQARVILLAEQQLIIPGAGVKTFKVPTWGRWKIEEGKWCWYVDVKDLQKTPWGTSPVNPMAKGNPAAGGMPQMPSAADMQSALTGVHAEKSKVELKEAGAEAEVKIVNGVPGAVNLTVPPNPLGLEASIAKPQLAKGESTVLRLKRLAGAKPGTVNVTVEPTNQVIPVQVVFE